LEYPSIKIAGATIMARPKKQPDERKSVPMSIRFSTSERMRIEQYARDAGLGSASEYVRRQALHGKLVIRQSQSLDPAIFDQLRRLGVNLNQLARIANTEGEIPLELVRLCSDIETFLMKEISGYGRT
jgi:mobilization protein NikA